MEQHEWPVLLVRQRPFVVGGVLPHEVHERQAVVRILRCPVVFPQRKPAEPPVVELHELPIGLGALFLREAEAAAFANHLADQVVVVGFGAVRPQAVRPQVGLHLEHAHVDPHLQDLPAIRWKLQNLAKLKGAKRAEQIQGLETCFQQEGGRL